MKTNAFSDPMVKKMEALGLPFHSPPILFLSLYFPLVRRIFPHIPLPLPRLTPSHGMI